MWSPYVEIQDNRLSYDICHPQDVRCSTPQSWQGSPLRAPVASLRPWLFQGIEPISEPVDRIADLSLAGLGDVPLHLHRTMDHGAIAPP